MMPRLVSTHVLARDLGLTERRVQQLVSDFILPPPRDGRHDRDLCADRYAAFRDPDGEGVERQQRAMLDEAAEAERLVRLACLPDASAETLARASLAHQAAMATARFVLMVGFRNNLPARALALRDLERTDEGGMRLLLGRAEQLMAQKAGVSVAEVSARLTEEGARREKADRSGEL